MNNEVDFDTLLRRALADIRHRARLPVVFGGTTDSTQRFTISRVVGGASGSLQGLLIRSGQGIGGLALASGRVATVGNYLDSARITHHYDSAVASEGLRSILAAPVIVGGEVRAVLYGASRSERSFSPATVNAFARCANTLAFEAAVAAETSRRLRKAETAAALREGLARRTVAPELALLHEAQAELLGMAQDTRDSALSARLTEIAHRLAPEPPLYEGAAPSPQPLSARESEVLALVALGLTNPVIADHLGIERETAKSYLRNCMRKLGVHSRTAAVTRARELRLLT